METDRILLRPWRESDAESLYKYASDPEVGPRAGWPPHKSVEESLEIIRTVFSNDRTWAIVLKETGEVIGCIGFFTCGESNIGIGENDVETGYWVARPYWNQGICTEALHLMIDYCFGKKGYSIIWSDFFVDNPASGRVMEKCGFHDTGGINYCSRLQVGSDRPVKVMKLENIKMGKGTMKMTCEKKEALTFIGFHTEIAPDEGYQKCPEFWDKEYAAKYARLWQTMKPETPVEEAILVHGIGMFAICSETETGFEYWIAGLYKGGDVPAGLELFTFPASNWAMFSTKGPIPASLQSLNTYVWQEWFPTEGKRLHANGQSTLEVYSAGNPQSPDYESGIWVPIAES